MRAGIDKPKRKALQIVKRTVSMKKLKEEIKNSSIEAWSANLHDSLDEEISEEKNLCNQIFAGDFILRFEEKHAHAYFIARILDIKGKNIYYVEFLKKKFDSYNILILNSIQFLRFCKGNFSPPVCLFKRKM